jgi:hypothetical protein
MTSDLNFEHKSMYCEMCGLSPRTFFAFQFDFSLPFPYIPSHLKDA